jgi:hypothetical protein
MSQGQQYPGAPNPLSPSWPPPHQWQPNVTTDSQHGHQPRWVPGVQPTLTQHNVPLPVHAMPSMAAPVMRVLPKRRNPFAVWLGLPLLTLGIYVLVWYYKTNAETQFSPRVKVNPALALLTVVLGGPWIIPSLVSFWRTGERICEAQRAAGLKPTCSPGLGMCLSFIGFAPLYYQIQMNKVVDSYPGALAGDRVPVRIW